MKVANICLYAKKQGTNLQGENLHAVIQWKDEKYGTGYRYSQAIPFNHDNNLTKENDCLWGAILQSILPCLKRDFLDEIRTKKEESMTISPLSERYDEWELISVLDTICW